MNKIKRNLLFVLLFSLIFVLSSCMNEEEKLLMEADKAFGQALEDMGKATEDLFVHMVDEECKNQCNSWGKYHLSEDEEINTCYTWCVKRCGSNQKCAEVFTDGMGVSQEREAKINMAKEECRKQALRYPCNSMKEEVKVNIENSGSTWQPPPEKANYFKNMCIYRCSENLQNLVKNGVTKEKLDEAFQKEYERISIIFKSNETCQCTEKNEHGKETIKEVLLFPSK